MTGKGLVKRILLTLALTAGFLILATVEANTTPIRPDLRKLLEEPQGAATSFVPARAGWQGPEMSTTSPKNADLLNQTAAAREMREALIAAAIPDLRILALIALVILLLRRIRRPAARVETMRLREARTRMGDESPPAKAA